MKLLTGFTPPHRAMVADVARDIILGKLPIADGATFDSHAEEHNALCLQNTRVDLLREITAWAQNPEAESCFWLNGMAGTGKSTISRTLARQFAGKGYLGANFFFKRGEGDRAGLSKFFTTIASQLIKTVPETTAHIQSVVNADPAIAGKSVREQFERLIITPLKEVPIQAGKERTILIVIDALDECEPEADVKALIRLFSNAQNVRSLKLRIFCTSRPELPLRLGFRAIRGTYQDLILHEIARPVIEHDISVFFKQRLEQIRHDYNESIPQELELSPEWPSPSDFQQLVEMAVPLFIFASTICLFIAEQRVGSPAEQLSTVLRYREDLQAPQSQLHTTYLPVLDQITSGLPEDLCDELLARFRNVVGTIAVLEAPLSTHALARMLGLPIEQVMSMLGMLHSVLSVPSSIKSPVRIFHLSFRDFLLHPDKRGAHPYQVDEKETHRCLAQHCLRIMGESLHADICGIQEPGTRLSSIAPSHIDEKLSPEVQYACQFWPHHLVQATVAISDEDEVHKFITTHFLHWLEALSLIGRLSESIQAIRTLQPLVKVSLSMHARVTLQ